MLLAELTVRHTRRHMPTRRVALDGAYLPTSGSAHGAALLSAVVATNLLAIDEEQRELLPRLLDDARRGLTIPRIALRHRLQHDVHGLDRSRHRVLGEDGRIVFELDVHGAPTPQVLGAVLGAASLPADRTRESRSTPSGAWSTAAGAGSRPRSASGSSPRRRGTASGRRSPPTDEWTPRRSARRGASGRGVAPDERWAMEVLGLRAGMQVERDDVNRRFRRMLRDAHPDSGGVATGAAARIAELTEARTILLAIASDEVAAEG